MPALKLIAGAFARHRVADTGLASLGVSAALVSMSFAGYMIVVGPQDGTSDDSRTLAGPVPAHAPRSADEAPAATADSDTVDFTPTGSIPTISEAPASRQPGAAPNAPVPDFFVRDVFDGTALVEARGTLHMVSPGDALEGAGQVLAIERSGRGWLVRTALGVIRQRR